jgi:hypothetical protein
MNKSPPASGVYLAMLTPFFEDLQEKHEFEGYIRPLKQSAACFNAA